MADEEQVDNAINNEDDEEEEEEEDEIEIGSQVPEFVACRLLLPRRFLFLTIVLFLDYFRILTTTMMMMTKRR